jgi:hypothetical protein
MRRKERKEKGKNFRCQVSGFRFQVQETGSRIRNQNLESGAGCRMQIADQRIRK